MTEEQRWEKVRQIVREENERLETRLIAALGKAKGKVDFINGKWIGITDQLLDAWSSAFPMVDVQAELRTAGAWILSNPTLSPKSQFSRFLMSWFSRSQNRSAIRSIPTRNEPKQRVCAWCGNVSTGMTNGNEHCAIHANKAMYEDPPRKIA